MKNKLFATVSITFIIGALSGIALVTLLSFSGSKPVSTPGPAAETITATEAHSYLVNYLASTDAPASRAKGFYLDLNQLAAMNLLAKNDSGVKGFRVYFGKATKEKSAPVFGIIVGVNDNGQDLYLKSIYRTDSPKTGPCPPVCDIDSPISKD
jgi:hypothetical protein